MTALGALAATADLADLTWPPGTILPFAGDAAPTGWILCDGQTAVGVTSALGIALGGASGRFGMSGSNPLVPDLRGRVPVGMASGSIGSSGGSLDHTHSNSGLTLAGHGHSHNYYLPDHGHSYSFYVGDHAHGYSWAYDRYYNANDSNIASVNGYPTGGSGNVGVGGTIYGPGNLGLGGSVGAAYPGVTGATAAANAPMSTFNFIVKT